MGLIYHAALENSLIMCFMANYIINFIQLFQIYYLIYFDIFFYRSLISQTT